MANVEMLLEAIMNPTDEYIPPVSHTHTCSHCKDTRLLLRAIAEKQVKSLEEEVKSLLMEIESLRINFCGGE